MNWSSFAYLLPVAVVALGLFALALRWMPDLTEPHERRTRHELVLLGGIVVLGLVAVYGNFLVGRSYFAYAIGDSGSDTIEQYVPFYLNLIGKARAGTLSLWNFEYELGVNTSSFQSWLFDPFNVVVVGLGLVLGEARLSLILVINQLLKVLAAAFLFDHLLTFYCEKPISRVVGSSLFAFSSFVFLYGQHYWFGAAYPLLALAVLALERYLHQTTPGRFLLVYAAFAVSLTWTAYVTMMLLVFCVLYVALRIPVVCEDCSPGTWAKTFARLAVPVVCGCLTSGVVMLPYAHFLLQETSRVSGDAGASVSAAARLGSFVPLDWIPAILSRSLGSGLINTGQITETYLVSPNPEVDTVGGFAYEFYMMGFSGGLYLLLSQFLAWVVRDAGRRERTCVCIATALVLLYCCNQFLPTLINALVKPSYRSSFLLAVPACLACAVAWDRRVSERRVALVPLAVAGVATIAVLAWSLAHTLNGRLICLYYLAAVCASLVLLVLWQRWSREGVLRALLPLAVAALVVSTSVVDDFFVTNLRGLVAGEAFPLSGATTWGEDTEAALGYLRESDPSLYRTEKVYGDWTPLNDALIQHYFSASAYNSTPDGDVDRFYETLWPEAVSSWAVYSQGYRNSPDSPEVSTLLGIRYVLSRDVLDLPWLTEEAVVEGVHIYRNGQADSFGSVRGAVMPESEADALPDAASRRALLAQVHIVEDEVAERLQGKLSGTVVASSHFELEGGSRISGEVTCDGDAVVCLPIPNTATWSVAVDGTPVETFRTNYGFIGFVVGAGSHVLALSYAPALLVPGIAVTACGVIGAVVSIIVLRRRKPKATAIEPGQARQAA